MDKATLDAKRAAIEKKRQELEARQASKGIRKEDDVLARAREMFSQDASRTQDSTTTINESTQASTVIESRNVDLQIVTLDEFMKKLPTPKPIKVDKEIQCDLDMAQASLNIEEEMTGHQTLEDTLKAAAAKNDQIIPPMAVTAIAALLHKPAKVYTREEQLKLFETEKFDSFIRYASKCMENILYKKIDIMNMIGEEDLTTRSARGSIVLNSKIEESDLEIEKAKIIQTLECPPRMNGCLIADLQWNPCLPDLLLVNYCRRIKEEDAYTQYPGKMLVWAASNNHRPEFVLQAKTRITRAQFDPYNPALIYGGMNNGAIAMWDVRLSSKPVSEVHPSNDSHFTPIYGLQVVGTRNSYNILSMSSEGKICVWEPSNMTHPILQVPLIAPKTEASAGRASIDSNAPMSSLTMVAPPGHFSKVFVAGIDRGIFHINLNSQSSSSHILQNFNDQSSGPDGLSDMHKGPICSLSYLTNYSGKSSLTQGLVLSSSFDWTMKLWYPQLGTKCLATFTAHESIVADAQWNSMHPGKFASCGADGKVLIWNLLRSFVLPVFEHKSFGVAYTKLQWNNDGHHLAVGDSEGRINIFQQKKIANHYDDEAEKNLKERLSSISTSHSLSR